MVYCCEESSGRGKIKFPERFLRATLGLELGLGLLPYELFYGHNNIYNPGSLALVYLNIDLTQL